MGRPYIWRSPLLLREKQCRSCHLVMMLLVLHRHFGGAILRKDDSRGCIETRQGQKYVSLLAWMVSLRKMFSFRVRALALLLYSMITNIPHVTTHDYSPLSAEKKRKSTLSYSKRTVSGRGIMHTACIYHVTWYICMLLFESSNSNLRWRRYEFH